MPEPAIIFVNRVYWPSETATAQLLADLAEELAARGRVVRVIAAGAETGDRRGVTVIRTGSGDRHRGLVSRAMNYGQFLRGARRALKSLVAPGDIVILLSDPPLLAAAGTGPVIRRRGRVLHWIQDIYPEIAGLHAGAWTVPFLFPLRVLRNRAWRRADRCLPVSLDMAATVRAQEVPNDSVLAMPNWAPRELDQPPPADAVAALRQRWGTGDRFVVAYSGNLGRVHEFGSILDAAEGLRNEDGIVFLFIGEGARLPEVRRSVATRNLPNVRFLPAQPRPELATALAAADAHLVTLRPGFERLVSPSKFAGVMAAGRPALLVGPETWDLAQLVEREGGGLRFAPGDGVALAAAIQRLRAEPASARALGQAARRCYEANFSFATSIARWEELLRAVAGSR